MKNVRVPLDIIWLDEGGRVVWIVERAQPCTAEPCPMYLPQENASMVLEVVGGFAQQHRLGLGDVVTILDSRF
jgi:uncharacterized membrane protein (UPF0127 family)